MIYLPKELPETKAGQDRLVEDYIARQRHELIERSTKIIAGYISKKRRAFCDICNQCGNISALVSHFMHTICDEVAYLKINSTIPFNKRIISPGLNNKDEVRSFIEDERERSRKEIERMFEVIFKVAFDSAENDLVQNISNAQSMEQISEIVIDLNAFCSHNGLPHYETVTKQQDIPADEFLQAIYDDEYEKKLALEERKTACLQIVEEYADKIVLPEVSTKDMWFSSCKKGAALSYAKRHEKDIASVLENTKDDQTEVEWIAVLNDRSVVNDIDLLITTKGISVLSWRKSTSSTQKSTAEFAAIKPGEKEGTLVIGNYEYSSKHVDVEALYEMIVKLASAVR
jgi:hypothetical protein